MAYGKILLIGGKVKIVKGFQFFVIGGKLSVQRLATAPRFHKNNEVHRALTGWKTAQNGRNCEEVLVGAGPHNSYDVYTDTEQKEKHGSTSRVSFSVFYIAVSAFGDKKLFHAIPLFLFIIVKRACDDYNSRRIFRQEDLFRSGNTVTVYFESPVSISITV